MKNIKITCFKYFHSNFRQKWS